MKHFSMIKCRLAEDEAPYRRTSLEIESCALIVVSQREGGSGLNMEMQQTQIQTPADAANVNLHWLV